MCEKLKKVLLNIFTDLFFIFGTSFLFALPWGLKNYPLHLQWNVFFVLASDTSGHDSGTARSILFGFVIPTIIVYILYRLVRFVLYKKSINIDLYKLFKVCALYFCVITIFLIGKTCAWRYFFIAHEVLKKPSYSKFYEDNFISYEDNILNTPSKRRNLIVIFMESMEPIYSDVEHGGAFKENLIPNLTRLAEQNINFSDSETLGGGYNLQGTSWTVAGLLSKFSGVPYFNPFSKDGNEIYCIKNAKTLNDYLYEEGYKQIFSMGSEKQFENRDLFFESHHVEIHDINWYKDNFLIPSDYQVFWGFEDAKLYPVARYELDKLGKQNEPFFYGLLTVDTHFPSGFVCSECKNELDSQMKNVIRCADKQVGDFIDWIKKQSWYDNTTIVIMGDHAYLDAPMNNFITEQGVLSKKETQEKRRFLSIIINPTDEIKTVKTKNRKYSSYDMMPTILSAIGYTFDNDGVALGRSLFSDRETLIETLGVKIVEQETMKNTAEYAALK